MIGLLILIGTGLERLEGRDVPIFNSDYLFLLSIVGMITVFLLPINLR